MNLSPEELQIKLQITEKAAELYVRQNGTFSLHQVAREVDLDPGDIFDYFPNKKAILEFYYTSLVIRYRMMLNEIEDFDTYSLSEKLSNFVFASFDMMAEQQEFVERSFNKIIRNSCRKTEYEQKIEQLLKSFFQDDALVATSSQMMTSDYFFSLLRKKYLWLVRFWLDDTSDNRELTMELTDKATAFLQEAAYSSVIDKGVDLLKFMFTNNVCIPRFTFFDNIASKIEIR